MQDDAYQTLVNAAFRFVSFRPRSEKELREFLAKKLTKFRYEDKGDNVLEKILVRLRELGYADDRKFTAWWVEQRRMHKPKGSRVLTQELRRKGISSDDITKALGSQTDSKQEKEQALQAIEKKRIIWKSLPVGEQKKKIVGFLERRGFSYDVIYRVIDEILGKDYNTNR